MNSIGEKLLIEFLARLNRSKPWNNLFANPECSWWMLRWSDRRMGCSPLWSPDLPKLFVSCIHRRRVISGDIEAKMMPAVQSPFSHWCWIGNIVEQSLSSVQVILLAKEVQASEPSTNLTNPWPGKLDTKSKILFQRLPSSLDERLVLWYAKFLHIADVLSVWPIEFLDTYPAGLSASAVAIYWTGQKFDWPSECHRIGPL